MKKKLLIVLAIMLLLGIVPAFATNVIADQNFKEYLNTKIIKPARAKNTAITKEDLKKVESFNLSVMSADIRKTVKNFEGIEHAVNLSHVYLKLHENIGEPAYADREKEYIFDLSPFAKLKNLTNFYFTTANLTDQNINDIGKITSLRNLVITAFDKDNLAKAIPTTLSGLGNLNNLLNLEFYYQTDKNVKIDASGIKNLTNVTHIKLIIPSLNDPELLKNKFNLKQIFIHFTGIKDLRVFNILPSSVSRYIAITHDNINPYTQEGNTIDLKPPYKYKSDYIGIDGKPIQNFAYNKDQILYEGNGVYKLKEGVEKAGLSTNIDGSDYRINFWLRKAKDTSTPIDSQGINIERIQGSSRFQTALKISDKLYTNANTAIIVNANKFPDALTSTVLSKKLKAPILLSGRNEIPASVNLKMKKLGVKNVIIVGGNLVISDRLERQLKTNYSVRRIGGRSRYETSELVANEIAGNGVVVARGDHFADALTISSLALKNDYPIYLTKPNVLTNSTFEKIKRRRPASIFIAGGVNAVNTGVESKLKTLSNVTRLGGVTRFDTSKKIAEHVYGNNVVNVMIARSDDFADAMVAGTLASKYQAPILLVGKKEISPEVKTYLISRKSTIKKGYIVGGTIAVPKVIETELKNLMK